MANFLEKLKKGMDIKEMPKINKSEGKDSTSSEEPTEEEIEKNIEPEKPDADKESGEELPPEEPEEDLTLEPEPAEPEEDTIPENEGIKTEEAPEAEVVTAGISFFKPEGKKRRKKSEKSKKKIKEKKVKIKKIEIKKEKLDRKSLAAIDKEELPDSEGQLVIDLYQTDGDIVIQSAIAGLQPEDLDISIENDMVKIKGKRGRTFERSGRNYFYQECHWGSFSREIILPVEVDANRAEATIKNGILTIRMPKIERIEKKKLRVKEK